MPYSRTTVYVVGVLAVLNATFDYARRLCRRSSEKVIVKLLELVRKISKAAAERSINVHGLRKERETFAALPPDTCLSFFDDYEIIQGTPVFTLTEKEIQTEEERLQSQSGPKTWDSFLDRPDQDHPPIRPSTSRESRDVLTGPGSSSKKEEERITCYAFSHNDQFFVCGRRDGSITVWNVQNGSLDRVLRGGHISPIGDVAFRKDSLATLVSIDIHGWCAKWDLLNDTYSRIRCAPVWEDPLYIGTEFAVPRLSHDGQYLGFPVYVYVEPSRENLSNVPSQSGAGLPITTYSGSSDETNGKIQLTRFYVVGYVYDLDIPPQGETENTVPILVLPVKIGERLNFEDSMLDLMTFSHSARRLLLTTYELCTPYLVLWPDAKQRSVESYKLTGTHGRFSQDDRYLVTWYGITSSKEQFTDCSCYVWDMNNLSKVKGNEAGIHWHHPNYKATNSLVLTDPDHGIVHTCGFVPLGKHIGIASASISDSMKIVIWSLQSADPIHVLDSTFEFGDVSSHDLRALIRDAGQLDRVPGMKCVGISNNGQWVGVYSPIKKKGIIWNPYLGTEILRMTLPSSTGTSEALMDFCFSESTTKMVMVGLTRTLLWSPSVLRSYNPKVKPIYTLTSDDEDIGMGETLCRFSEDGQSVGLLRAQAFSMDVWYLHPQRQFTLNRKEIRTEMANICNSRRRRPNRELQAGKYRFGHFALSANGGQVVTCMCDMSVLLWKTDEPFQCRRIAILTSQYRPALDVCFSMTPSMSPTVVICQDQGIFLWICLTTDEIIDRKISGGIMRCKFTSKGTIGVIMSNLYHLKIWNLVSREKVKEVDYSIPLMRTIRGDFYQGGSRQGSGFSPKLSQDASFCLVGFKEDRSPIIAEPNTSPESLTSPIWNPLDVVLSEDGEWAVLMGLVDAETDDIAFSCHRVPDFENPVLDDPYPEIIYDESADPDPIMAAPYSKGSSNTTVNQTFKLIHLKGVYRSKQMRLPCSLRMHKLLAVTEDGKKFAALNTHNRLVVWGTHFTYKHVVQQRWELVEGNHSNNPSSIEDKLDEYGASLVNHPYMEGTTPFGVIYEVSMLKCIIDWAKRSGIHLSFHGSDTSQEFGSTGRVKTTNALDLAVNSCSPHIAQIILQAIVQGTTSETCLSRILEQSLINLSYKYPTLVLEFFKTSGIMKPLCTVNISESYFQSGNGYHGLLTDKRLVASPQYIQDIWTMQETATAKRLRQTAHLEIQAEAKVVPYPNIAKIGSEGLLQPLLLHKAQHFVFSTDLMNAVINYKYFAYARSLLLEDLYHHLFLLFIFTSNCISVGKLDCTACDSSDDTSRKKESGLIFITVLATFVAFGSLVRFLMQVHTIWLEQAWNGLLYYANNVQKWIELVYCVLLVVVIPLLIVYCGFASDEVAAFMAVASVLLWMKLLFYAQAFKSTGPMVIMMREIIFDIRWFLFILFAFLVGFGVAFFVLLANTREKNEKNDDPEEDKNGYRPFSDPWMSTLAMILMMLSEVGDSVDAIYDKDLSLGILILTVAILVTFLAAVAVVLLNLLIAIMGDSFDRVKNHEKSLFLQKRAEVVQDMEMCLSHRRRQKFNARIERYLHVLTPHFRSRVYEREWEGRLVDIQRRMRQELVEIGERESQEFDGLRSLVNEVKTLLHRLLEAVNSKTLFIVSVEVFAFKISCGIAALLARVILFIESRISLKS